MRSYLVYRVSETATISSREFCDRWCGWKSGRKWKLLLSYSRDVTSRNFLFFSIFYEPWISCFPSIFLFPWSFRPLFEFPAELFPRKPLPRHRYQYTKKERKKGTIIALETSEDPKVGKYFRIYTFFYSSKKVQIKGQARRGDSPAILPQLAQLKTRWIAFHSNGETNVERYRILFQRGAIFDTSCFYARIEIYNSIIFRYYYIRYYRCRCRLLSGILFSVYFLPFFSLSINRSLESIGWPLVAASRGRPSVPSIITNLINIMYKWLRHDTHRVGWRRDDRADGGFCLRAKWFTPLLSLSRVNLPGNILYFYLTINLTIQLTETDGAWANVPRKEHTFIFYRIKISKKFRLRRSGVAQFLIAPCLLPSLLYCVWRGSRGDVTMQLMSSMSLERESQETEGSWGGARPRECDKWLFQACRSGSMIVKQIKFNLAANREAESFAIKPLAEGRVHGTCWALREFLSFIQGRATGCKLSERSQGTLEQRSTVCYWSGKTAENSSTSRWVDELSKCL